MSTRFLNYSIAAPTRNDKTAARYVVTAEYTDGYEVLSYHETKAEAQTALQLVGRGKPGRAARGSTAR